MIRTVIKAKNKFLGLLKNKSKHYNVSGLDTYVNLYQAYMNISERLEEPSL